MYKTFCFHLFQLISQSTNKKTEEKTCSHSKRLPDERERKNKTEKSLNSCAIGQCALGGWIVNKIKYSTYLHQIMLLKWNWVKITNDVNSLVKNLFHFAHYPFGGWHTLFYHLWSYFIAVWHCESRVCAREWFWCFFFDVDVCVCACMWVFLFVFPSATIASHSGPCWLIDVLMQPKERRTLLVIFAVINKR